MKTMNMGLTIEFFGNKRSGSNMAGLIPAPMPILYTPTPTSGPEPADPYFRPITFGRFEMKYASFPSAEIGIVNLMTLILRPEIASERSLLIDGNYCWKEEPANCVVMTSATI
jgi:hypothetical protein